MATAWDDYLDLVLERYAGRPDDHVLSIGDWSDSDSPVAGDEIPRFRAFLRMKLGDLRALRAQREAGGHA